MVNTLILIVLAIFILAYRIYGRFLSKRISLDDGCATPACRVNDGVDYVPAKSTLLLGQHFSAIAAAGPIVGPILACLWFGWLPALLWIVLGAIFIGGAHDFFSLTASIRHNGASIGEIVKERMHGNSYKFFLAFVWLALTYVIIAFTDITAHTFKVAVAGTAFGPGVAASSLIYLLLAMAMGIALYRFKTKLWLATAIFLPLVLATIWAGPRLPEGVLAYFTSLSIKQWDAVLLLYCLIASIIPVWLLLQPRGYLGGWLLYLVIIIGLVGALFGGMQIKYPAVNLDGLRSAFNGKAIFPLLFITIACGACSGFHGIVSSGTTSKQVSKETDALPIAYGAMLLEALVAVLAIITVAMLPIGNAMLKSDPNIIYANGIANFLGMVRIPYEAALAFALLAFSTFVYDTLDVSARLARYVLQELTGWRTRAGAMVCGAFSVAVPFVFLMLTKEKGYLVAWPIFGASNQLLAGFILLAVSAWLIQLGRKPFYTIMPMLFMLAVTVWALVQMVMPFALLIPGMLRGTWPNTDIVLSGIFGLLLLALTFCLAWEARKVFWKRYATKQTPITG